MTTHLGLTTTTLATLWEIARLDGTTFRFTDHDQDLTFGGNTYVSTTGFSRSAVENTSDMAVDNLDVKAFFDDSSLTENDLRAGLFDYAEIFVFLVNWRQPDTDGRIRLRRGRLGEVSPNTNGSFTAELRGMAQLLSQNIIDVYGPDCRADLGDSQCKVPIDPSLRANSTAYVAGDANTVPSFMKVATAVGTGQAVFENRIYECTTAGTSAASAPTFNTTPGATTADGTAVWTAREAWTRHATVASVTNNRSFALMITESRAVDGWFEDGVLSFESGLNNGAAEMVSSWTQSGSSLTLFRSLPFNVQVGDALKIYPGCNKILADPAGSMVSHCINKFQIAGSVFFANGNILNARGEPFIPGPDVLTNYPDSRA